MFSLFYQKLSVDILSYYNVKLLCRYTKYDKLLIMMDVNIKKLALQTKLSNTYQNNVFDITIIRQVYFGSF